MSHLLAGIKVVSNLQMSRASESSRTVYDENIFVVLHLFYGHSSVLSSAYQNIAVKQLFDWLISRSEQPNENDGGGGG